MKFSSSLREILECIKYSKDKEKFASFLKNNPRMVFDREAALVFKAITNTPIDIPEGLEEIDVCKAVEEMILESTEKGIGIGEMRMLVKQVRKGRLTVEEAAEDAGMTVEKFKEAISHMEIKVPPEQPIIRCLGGIILSYLEQTEQCH